jgi:cytochrome d ubiquinol oxidase subunit I
LSRFAISFPAKVLFVEWLGLRTGDQLYLPIARRWTRVIVALFAVGVIAGTVLSFEMGLLWPNFTGRFGSVFGLGFAIEGFSFFMEAIFIGNNSQRVDEHPGGFRLRAGRVVDVDPFKALFANTYFWHELIHM